MIARPYERIHGRVYRQQWHQQEKHFLTPERIAELDVFGFVWSSALEDQCTIMFNRLGQSEQQYGHCNVPRSFSKGDYCLIR